MFGLMPLRKEKRLMRRGLDPLFDRLFGDFPMAYLEEERPYWDLEVLSEEKEIVVRVEAPGFEVADFDIRVKGELLTILVEHKETTENDEKKVGRAYARLERTVILPPGLDLEKVEAIYRSGVLEVHLPKLPEPEGKKIEVKA